MSQKLLRHAAFAHIEAAEEHAKSEIYDPFLQNHHRYRYTRPMRWEIMEELGDRNLSLSGRAGAWRQLVSPQTMKTAHRNGLFLGIILVIIAISLVLLSDNAKHHPTWVPLLQQVSAPSGSHLRTPPPPPAVGATFCPDFAQLPQTESSAKQHVSVTQGPMPTMDAVCEWVIPGEGGGGNIG